VVVLVVLSVDAAALPLHLLAPKAVMAVAEEEQLGTMEPLFKQQLLVLLTLVAVVVDEQKITETLGAVALVL
jgi:hypothetical protein